jgi:hypothetical protein
MLQLARNLQRINLIDPGSNEQILLPLHFRRVVHVLVRVRRLVFQDFDEFVETCRHDAAEHGAQPVDPVVVVECQVDDCGPERARGVQAAAGEVDAC